MVLISYLVKKPNCNDGILPKLSRLKYIPSIFTKYQLNIIYNNNNFIFNNLENVQYKLYSTYTHSSLNYKSHTIKIHNGNNFLFKSIYKCYSSISESEFSDSIVSSTDSTTDHYTDSEESSKKPFEICYEDYWDDNKIEEVRKLRPELIIKGIVNYYLSSSSDSKVVCYTVNSLSGSSLSTQTNSVSTYQNSKDKNNQEFKIYGFISRNRSFHGDEVIAIKARRQKSEVSIENMFETKNECRVVKILKRASNLNNFLCYFNSSDFLDDSVSQFKVYAKDTKLPPFVVEKSKINNHLFEQLPEPDQKLYCLCSFSEWNKSELEPRAVINSIIGRYGLAKVDMDVTMACYGLVSSEFSDEVLSNLDELIKQGNEKKHLNRHNMNDLFVLSIDPEDAKDLDDALSIEKLTDSKNQVYYRIGIHVADVSHYVQENSLVDLDARNRANSVYMEHQVYPMLPQALSENLCSLVPNKESLCFSVFADVVETGDGEKIGHDLYLKKVEFKLTSIISKNRLTYNNAKNLIFSCLNTKKGLKDPDVVSQPFKDFEQFVDSLNLVDKTKISLLRLYFLSQKLRFYRLKQLGAVHVDVGSSVKCLIPDIHPDFDKHNLDEYFNKKGKLEKKYQMKIEKIPMESHELIEEMMLLANTQVARFLSEKMDLCLLRIHPDTSKDVMVELESIIPKNLKSLINFDELSLTQILNKCEENMDPTAFHSLSFKILQQFKDALYSPIKKLGPSSYDSADSKGQYHHHWGLALPFYLHFTSPIRRYPDLYTHRMLKNILYDQVDKKSLENLHQICDRCNLHKKAAFEASKEYKNFAFNKYLQFLSFICKKVDSSYLKGLGVSLAYKNPELVEEKETQNKEDVWGYVYGDACIASIEPTQSTLANLDKAKPQDLAKTSISFYIPLLNEQRTIKCDNLGLVPVSLHFESKKKQKGNKKQKINNTLLVSYYTKNLQELETPVDEELEEKEKAKIKVHGLSAMIENKRMEFHTFQKMKVLLVPGYKMWTVRLPAEHVK